MEYTRINDPHTVLTKAKKRAQDFIRTRERSRNEYEKLLNEKTEEISRVSKAIEDIENIDTNPDDVLSEFLKVQTDTLQSLERERQTCIKNIEEDDEYIAREELDISRLDNVLALIQKED